MSEDNIMFVPSSVPLFLCNKVKTMTIRLFIDINSQWSIFVRIVLSTLFQLNYNLVFKHLNY